MGWWEGVEKENNEVKMVSDWRGALERKPTILRWAKWVKEILECPRFRDGQKCEFGVKTPGGSALFCYALHRPKGERLTKIYAE